MNKTKPSVDQSPSATGSFMGSLGRTMGSVFGRILGWVLPWLLIGAGLLFAFDYFIERPADYFCSRTQLCSPPTVEVPPDIYVPTVERVQALSQLTTTRYNYSHIVTGQTDMPGILATLYGESLVMVAVGHIQAGIDVSSITADSVVYDEINNQLTVSLPAPTLQDCFLDEGESYIVERKSGLFAQPSPAIDTATRRYALRQFLTMALEDGILEEARTQAVAVMSGLIGDLTQADVQIEIAPADPNAPLPDTCQ